jgi:hypothetical protein
MRILMIVVGALAALVLGGYVFREPLMTALFERMTADMFVESDSDAYDVGPAVGTKIPAIRALHDGAELTDVTTLAGSRGLVLIPNRSVDW